MANWCNTEYTFIGGKEDIAALYSLLKELETKCKENDTKGGWDGCWLGNIVEGWGKDPRKIPCRGEFYDLRMRDQKLTFRTRTAWNNCNEVMDLICEKFDTLRYFYRSEEPGGGIFSTNDANHKYYEPYKIEVWNPQGVYYEKYFQAEDEIVKYLNEKERIGIRDISEIPDISKKWEKENDEAYIHVFELEVLSSAEEDFIKVISTEFWRKRFE